jgi:hypothetical protein
MNKLSVHYTSMKPFVWICLMKPMFFYWFFLSSSSFSLHLLQIYCLPRKEWCCVYFSLNLCKFSNSSSITNWTILCMYSDLRKEVFSFVYLPVSLSETKWCFDFHYLGLNQYFNENFLYVYSVDACSMTVYSYRILYAWRSYVLLFLNMIIVNFESWFNVFWSNKVQKHFRRFI